MAKRKVTTKAKKAVRSATRKVKGAARKTKRAAPKDPNALIASQMTAVTPYLAVGDAAGAIEWYKKVFQAKTVGQTMPAPGGKVMHATIKIGDALLFLSDIFPGSEMQDPSRAGPSVSLNVYHRDADRMWERAVANGAKVVMPLDDQFWGDRYGKILDPFGHSWAISWKSRLSKAELERKREEAMRQFGAPQA